MRAMPAYRNASRARLTNASMKTAGLLLTCLLFGLALASRGEGSAGAREPANADAAQQQRGKLLRLGRTRFGTILVDGRRRALYLFTRDRRNRSRCYGACAEAWPPFLTRGAPRAGRGISRRLLGTTRRRDGRRQVTYRGRPLYFYVGDRRPLEVRCQAVPEFGGTWYVVNRRGNAIR
jgi:predicted lipoprotein with Yx(FWY)xxD motif